MGGGHAAAHSTCTQYTVITRPPPLPPLPRPLSNSWTAGDVQTWLAENGHPVAVIKAFADGGVEGAMLLELDRQDLESDMKIEPTTCTRINKEIKDLQRDTGMHSSGGADESTTLPPSINRFDHSRGVSP